MELTLAITPPYNPHGFNTAKLILKINVESFPLSLNLCFFLSFFLTIPRTLLYKYHKSINGDRNGVQQTNKPNEVHTVTSSG